METLSKLFGSTVRVRLMRLFLFNVSENYDTIAASERVRAKTVATRRELVLLEKSGLIRRRKYYKEVVKKKNGQTFTEKKRVEGWTLDSSFPYLVPLQGLLVESSLLTRNELIHKLNKIGKLKLLVVAGVFNKDWESRVDVLVVGDKIKKSVLEKVIKDIEAEIGRVLNYATFETSDFTYRYNVCDKLIRDIFEYPHEKLINKMGI